MPGQRGYPAHDWTPWSPWEFMQGWHLGQSHSLSGTYNPNVKNSRTSLSVASASLSASSASFYAADTVCSPNSTCSGRALMYGLQAVKPSGRVGVSRQLGSALISCPLSAISPIMGTRLSNWILGRGADKYSTVQYSIKNLFLFACYSTYSILQ